MADWTAIHLRIWRPHERTRAYQRITATSLDVLPRFHATLESAADEAGLIPTVIRTASAISPHRARVSIAPKDEYPTGAGGTTDAFVVRAQAINQGACAVTEPEARRIDDLIREP